MAVERSRERGLNHIYINTDMRWMMLPSHDPKVPQHLLGTNATYEF